MSQHAQASRNQAAKIMTSFGANAHGLAYELEIDPYLVSVAREVARKEGLPLDRVLDIIGPAVH